MKKALLFFAVAAISLALAFRFYRPNLSLFASASGGESGGLADMDQRLPRTVLPAVDGNWVDMESYKGKVVFVNIWATWCQPCRDEIPDLIKLQEKFASRGFTVVAIAVDDQGEESVQTFVQKERFRAGVSSTAINYPVLLGSDETARKFGFEGELPVSFLVTRDGKEVKIIRGSVGSEEVSDAIQHLL
ncbi:MAG TPA: TlpA disulfide reductase family protein [Candidatus Acidoferrum sp.]|nr:TlpA disulfide reductase family protein [Candidatus Acidoferrum sp.]